MKKFIIFPALLACLLVGCGQTNKEKEGDSVKADSAVEVAASKNYKPVDFKTQEDVTKFLAFKKFSNSNGWIAFNGDGGVIDNEYFKMTKISLLSPTSAKLEIELPKKSLSGSFTLNQNEDGVTLTDDKTGKIYKLSNN